MCCVCWFRCVCFACVVFVLNKMVVCLICDLWCDDVWLVCRCLLFGLCSCVCLCCVLLCLCAVYLCLCVSCFV